MKNFSLSYLLFAPLLLILGSPSIAFAHVGVGSAQGFIAGLAHPVSGLDHLCAMMGVGIWAAQRGGKAIWLLPVAFLAVMALGGLLGAAAIALPFADRGVVLSVLILGILIAAAVRMPLVLSTLVVGAFALFHGHVHGAEMPLTASGLTYGVGFMATTAFLLFAGAVFGVAAAKATYRSALRFSGAAMILVGVYLLVR
ncbi:MAG TPA: HupE/UreJ family protein [Lacipirellulaceae bacterium]|nr:HupE/UreJ family protein [Lacipirellulaceae bacterium]